MKEAIFRLKGLMLAIIVLALSASLTFGAQAPVGGYALGGSFQDHGGAGAAGDEDEDTDEAGTTDEETGEEDAEDAADNCLTDPTGVTPEELAAMSHGSVACWAAHQTEWPEWFSNKGKFVSCWAHQGKPDAPSCTEAPTEDAAATTHGKSEAKGQAKGKAKGQNKP